MSTVKIVNNSGETEPVTITCILFLAALDLLDKDFEKGIMSRVPLLNEVFKPADHLHMSMHHRLSMTAQ